MIGHVTGKLKRKQPPELLIDVNGIGYELEAPMTVFYDLPALDVEVTLHTHLVVRADAHQLFGFTEVRQRNLFRELLRVSGVGPRVGLAILSALTVEDLIRAISFSDSAQLTRIPGIGRKTAERLIIDLRDRFDESMGGEQTSSEQSISPEQDAVRGLVKLGYRSSDAAKVVKQLRSPDASTEELVRNALKQLGGVQS
ncbi:MAG: Holliday junction branch migration protein RuvA [Acidiferrobacteraceae bacterium]|nr:Holliday junction branch migration protein RuvA [Acidiferrobacteraceae bacterium]|tara:strand:+ start:348 stop:941 length:594 start_codon:yes stop_codon:yes gene_type:complete